MKDAYLLHIFSPTKNVSPFDINMAYEANYDAVIPYCNVTLDEIHGLTQDTIFSRNPEGVRRTGIFIGGRDLQLALDMLAAARAAMVPPFAVSVLADPSGAITTAAAIVALAEQWSARTGHGDLAGKAVYVFGGTGPVGTCCALLAATGGARVHIVSNRGADEARAAASGLGTRHGVLLQGVDGSTPRAIATLLEDAEIVINTAKAGVRVLDAASLRRAHRLRVAVDANAVPPTGVEGIALKDNGAALASGATGAVGVGALAVGDVKYRVHTGLLAQMYAASTPLYLAHHDAFALARRIVAKR
jgi:methylene-tetrahydromethanopterin dehydrogenase